MSLALFGKKKLFIHLSTIRDLYFFIWINLIGQSIAAEVWALLYIHVRLFIILDLLGLL